MAKAEPNPSGCFATQEWGGDRQHPLQKPRRREWLAVVLASPKKLMVSEPLQALHPLRWRTPAVLNRSEFRLRQFSGQQWFRQRV
ncbi:hypothetical protein, partial [Rhodopirellula bahusiensis]|uniref:hypothetical protein n=1 Tax=Rhodopirellula bahusiensis TaxID=2014065 RepID=UPI0032660CDA